MGTIPESFIPAKWRGTLPADNEGCRGISFDLQTGEVIRIKLDKESSKHVSETLSRDVPFSDIIGNTKRAGVDS